jgi:hypothetical protein
VVPLCISGWQSSAVMLNLKDFLFLIDMSLLRVCIPLYVLCVGVLMSLSARNLVNGKAAGDGRQQPGSARDSISSDGDDQVTE